MRRLPASARAAVLLAVPAFALLATPAAAQCNSQFGSSFAGQDAHQRAYLLCLNQQLADRTDRLEEEAKLAAELDRLNDAIRDQARHDLLLPLPRLPQ